MRLMKFVRDLMPSFCGDAGDCVVPELVSNYVADEETGADYCAVDH